ncbi:MAG: hypothetical protein ACPGQS_14630 [Bradymonadia bacterium]
MRFQGILLATCQYLAIAVLTCILVGCGETEGSSSSMDGDKPDLSCRVEAPTHSAMCTGAQLSEYYCDAFAGSTIDEPTTIGAEQPFWVLRDAQPQSCGYEQFYGLEGLRGKPTMVVLLWSGCGFCQAQTEKLQEMHFELQSMNVDVNFVIVDRASTNAPVENLTDRCSFPIFQDEAEIDAWGLLGGGKDDFYFYDSAGVLRNFIPSTDDIVLTSYEDPPMEPTSGYTNIKNAVIELVENDVSSPETPPGEDSE